MASYENLYNYTAERYVLGSILIDANVMNGVSGTLGVNDFYNLPYITPFQLHIK